MRRATTPSPNNPLVSNGFLLPAAGTPTLLSSRWRIYCNQTLIGNRVLRAPGDKALPSGRTHTKITRYARNLRTHTRRLRGANQSLSAATLKFHSRKTLSSRRIGIYLQPHIGETCEFAARGANFYNANRIDRYGEKNDILVDIKKKTTYRI